MSTARTGRPGAGEYDPYYDRYVQLVPSGDIVEILAQQIGATVEPLRRLDDAGAGRAYAPGKWTVAEVVGHICDAERVFAQRAFRFARGDTTALPGFDENAYVPAGAFGSRSLTTLLDELVAVRRATVALFSGLPDAAWTRRGTASGAAISVRALACIIAGHELHHRGLLATRYGVAAMTA